MKFLNNPDSHHDNSEDPFFKMPTKKTLVYTARPLMERLFKTLPPGKTQCEEMEDVEKVDPENISLEKRLEDAINAQTLTTNKASDDVFKSLQKEFDLYAATGKLTPNLTMLFNSLKTIRPTSVESERAFSALGLFVTKLRNRLSCKTIDILSFLKAYYKNKS